METKRLQISIVGAVTLLALTLSVYVSYLMLN